jgi:hypothetical protein
MKRSIETDMRAMQTRTIPEPCVPLNSEESAGHYAALWSDIPSHEWHRRGVNMMVCQASELMAQIDRLNAELAKAPIMIESSQGEKAHPAFATMATLVGRLGTVLSRLKVTPQGDARENARQAKHEAARGTVAVISGSGGQRDWREEAKRRGHMK